MSVAVEGVSYDMAAGEEMPLTYVAECDACVCVLFVVDMLAIDSQIL